MSPFPGIAYMLLLLVSFHGSVSTIAMVAFTKPIRLGVLSVFQRLLPWIVREQQPIVVAVTESASSTSNHRESLARRKSIFDKY